MDLTHIAVFAAGALLVGWLARGEARRWLIMASSVVALFWLQPVLPIRGMGFWLPLVALALCVLVWVAIRSEGENPLPAVLLAVGLVFALGVMRYSGPLCCLTPTRPPQFGQIAAGVGVIGVVSLALDRGARKQQWLPIAGGIALIALLVALKTPLLAGGVSAGLRGLVGQSVEQASPFDLRWLGISYIVFRLIYALQAHRAGRLPSTSLRGFLSYALFFPALTAGPIARADKFLKQWAESFTLSREVLFEAGQRISVGLFKKFALADTLALFALNDLNALQTGSTLWTWVLLYAYAYRIYFDFAGYTDIAIGIGRLVGIALPENFEKPYSKPNLALFWNSWHITLALWFRALWFNPLSRFLRRRWKGAPTWALVALTQVTTMVLVGVWHGVTLNFFIWGLWHGVGLFVHNRWAQATRTQQRRLKGRPRLQRLVDFGSTLVTFHFVVLGWVWFALSSPALAWAVLMRLFGVG